MMARRTRAERCTTALRHEDRVLDVPVGVDPHVRAQDGSLHQAPRDDAAGRDDGFRGRPTAPVLGEDELGGRELRLVGAHRPVGVVEVEDGVHLDEVHRGLVVGVERADVAPVLGLLLVLVPEEMGVDRSPRCHQLRDDVPAEVVARGLLGVPHQLPHEEVRVEDVHAHRAEAVAGVPGRCGGALPASPGSRRRGSIRPPPGRRSACESRHGNLDGRHGELRAPGDVDVEHLAVVHLVDVVARQDDDPPRAARAPASRGSGRRRRPCRDTSSPPRASGAGGSR